MKVNRFFSAVVLPMEKDSHCVTHKHLELLVGLTFVDQQHAKEGWHPVQLHSCQNRGFIWDLT